MNESANGELAEDMIDCPPSYGGKETQTCAVPMEPWLHFGTIRPTLAVVELTRKPHALDFGAVHCSIWTWIIG
jgi:hypothetical protein